MQKKQNILSNAELSAFCQQIAMVLSAGLPTYYGISILRDEAVDNPTKELLDTIYKPMENGCTLHCALSDTGMFPHYMIHMIRLGEETGRLEEVLLSLSSYFEREDNIRYGIKSAVTYPFILAFLILAVIVIMTAKVIPVFSQISIELGSELNSTSMILMSISNLINKNLIVFIIIFLLLFITGIIVLKTGIGQILFQKHRFAMAIASSRFANCMFLALSSGLDTDRGLDLADELVNNPYMSLRIKLCREYLDHGENFATALTGSGIFTKMYSSWIAIGYKTGSMDEIMDKISNAYENETTDRLNRFVSVFEPTLIIIICGFITLILVSFLLPLLGILSSIG